MSIHDLQLPLYTQKKMLQTDKYLQISKAPKPDQISNKVLKVIMLEISSQQELIFNNSLAISYYPSQFKEFIIIILRKEEGIRDYSSPKNKQLISLPNIVRKITEAVVVARISYIASTYNLLPKRIWEAQGDNVERRQYTIYWKKFIKLGMKTKLDFFSMIDVSAVYLKISHQSATQ